MRTKTKQKTILQLIMDCHEKTFKMARVAEQQKRQLKLRFNFTSDKKVAQDLKKRVQEIQEINSRRLIEKYAQEISSEIYKKDNYLITPNQAQQYAINKFIEKKNNNEIDFYNREVQ